MRIDLWNEVSSNGQRPYIETALLPRSSGPRPLIVVCPGGGYTHFGRYEGLPVAGRFNKLGFHAVVLEYRIKPTKFPEPVQDLLRAIRIVRMICSSIASATTLTQRLNVRTGRLFLTA